MEWNMETGQNANLMGMNTRTIFTAGTGNGKSLLAAINKRSEHMKMIGNYRAFSVAMTDEELIKAIPIAAEELLVELFDACGKSALKPKIETLEIFYKHAGKYDGPFGMVDPSNDSEKPIRATLAVKIGAEESGN